MKTSTYKVLLLLAALTWGLTSCDDDELVKTPLDLTEITEDARTVSTLSFTWSAVPGATQYAYELTSPQGDVVLGGITNTTSLLATGLKPSTTYTLNVWAYADPLGHKTTSPIATLQATTNEVIALSTPQATWEQTSAGIVLTWPAVEHAQYYEIWYYTGTSDEPEYIQTTSNSITLQNLSLGAHKVIIQASTDDENYSNSITFELEVTRSKTEIWRTECNYNAPVLDTNFTCQVVAFDDGSYEIQGLYGSDDKLEFTTDEANTFTLLNAYSISLPYYYVKAGDYTLCLYLDDGYSFADCSRSQGEVWFYCYLYDSNFNNLGGEYDYINWGSEEEESIDLLVGEYTETSTCYDMTYDWTNWTAVTDQQSDVTIEKIDDETISIYNFYGWESTLTAHVDMANRTITVEQNAIFADYYTFADFSGADKAVIGTFDENYTITFRNWSIWYGGYPYIYEGAYSILTRK